VEGLTQLRYGHDSTIITKDLLVAVEIGIKSPEGLIPVIPKYVSCRESKWKRKKLSFCRIISEYGPYGISDAIKSSKIKMLYDPIYRIKMPYIKKEDIMIYNNPKDVFTENFIYSYKYIESLPLFDLIKDLDIKQIGITGSYSLGMQYGESDIDLVIYGEKNVELIYNKFINNTNIIECKNSFGGVIIDDLCVPWRRGTYRGMAYSWTGVPNEIASHCDPIKDYNKIIIPDKVENLNVYIPNGQINGLLYPPCVRDSNGRYIISFEFNAGYLLYNGGHLSISGLSNEKSIIIGTREFPGKISKIGSKS
jgi:hypothetical protein